MYQVRSETDHQLKQHVDSINLECIVNRLVNIHSWPKKSALLVMQQYRKFLFLKKKYGHQYSLPPSMEIDEFWHTHILHTNKYHQDCLSIFGEYLHHSPYHGESENTARLELEKMFEQETQELYLQEFGEPIFQVIPRRSKKNLLRKLISIYHSRRKSS
jgi:hypothetical protein